MLPLPLVAGRKYELRVVVYRDGDELRAYPSVVKVNRQTFDPEHPTRESLLNNITTSANETSSSGLNFILPLCSSDTLATLGISEQELQELCTKSTQFLRYVVDQVQDCPHMFGLSGAAS